MVEINGVSVLPFSVVEFTYKNWRGEVSERRVRFDCLFYGSTEYHPEPQFLLAGLDVDKGVHRAFAVKDISDLEVVA